MTNSRPTLSEDLISKVLAIKPSYLTNTGFINYLIELGYQTRLQQQKNMRECEILCQESILNTIRTSIPVDKI